MEKELGFPLLVEDPGPSTLHRSSSEDSLTFAPPSKTPTLDATDTVLIIDQIYSNEEHTGDLDGVAMFNDIGETAKLAARLTDETTTVYFGESSGTSLFCLVEVLDG